MASIKKLSGVTIAMAAAGLLLSGNALAAEKSKAEEGTVHCAGINSCKGQTSCKSATNDCKGKNGCKGHGWLSVSKEECEKKGGKIVSEM